MADTLGPMRLTETDLLAAAGDTVFGRGEDYVQYVRGLRVRGSNATATIQARRVYEVELDWSGEEPTTAPAVEAPRAPVPRPDPPPARNASFSMDRRAR